MVDKYSRKLENREYNKKTGSIYALQDVPPIWRSQTEQKVIDDGYYFDVDGTAYPVPVNEE